LVDAVIAYFQQASWAGNLAVLKSGHGSRCLSVRFVLEATLEDGSSRKRYESAEATADGSWHVRSPKKDVSAMRDEANRSPQRQPPAEFASLRDRVVGAIADAEADFRSELSEVQTVRGRLVGLATVIA
jgi:hypothetical protein